MFPNKINWIEYFREKVDPKKFKWEKTILFTHICFNTHCKFCFNFPPHIFSIPFSPLHPKLYNKKYFFPFSLLLYTKFISLRKVKMDQRKLMDNANTITDMAKTQNTVYEIVSDMATRQDTMDERVTRLEEKIQHIQVCGVRNGIYAKNDMAYGCSDIWPLNYKRVKELIYIFPWVGKGFIFVIKSSDCGHKLGQNLQTKLEIVDPN